MKAVSEVQDLADVIKALDACTRSDDCAGHSCPYWDCSGDLSCRIQMETDAISLLQEQHKRIWELTVLAGCLQDQLRDQHIIESLVESIRKDGKCEVSE